ncbi:MAG: glycosyltransferase [Thermodesulfobacteriota bacterium]
MDRGKADYSDFRRKHWDAVALRMGKEATWGEHYHNLLIHIYRKNVPPGLRVLEIGCSQGDLLAALEPSLGVGIDHSRAMVKRACERHPHLVFLQADGHELPLRGPFDVVIMSDLVNDLWDVQAVFEEVSRVSVPQTRLILNAYSRLWELPLALTQRFNLAMPTLNQNWLTVEDLINLLKQADYQVVRHWSEILCPLAIPGLASLLNRFMVRFWPFRVLALTNFLVARPVAFADRTADEPVVSVIVPARNEEGNIEQIIERMPEMGGGTEIIFVEGHSSDNTYEAIRRAIASHPERRAKLFRQSGEGKGDAVRLGFQNAEGEVLMILDADLTVAPEDLPRFYRALVSGKGELINGVRLVYPMENEAMRLLNLVGNKVFGLSFSWLLGQSLKDTLCGTKVLWKDQYRLIAANRGYFGEIDPYGDFDLILGAARLNLEILDLPIRYRGRVYGTTNIRRWSGGLLLLRMTLTAARKITFS